MDNQWLATLARDSLVSFVTAAHRRDTRELAMIRNPEPLRFQAAHLFGSHDVSIKIVEESRACMAAARRPVWAVYVKQAGASRGRKVFCFIGERMED